jgi:Mycothiol maleylpyruvate isomerase N-terminal domain
MMTGAGGRAPAEGRTEVEAVIDGCRKSHRRLLETVAGLDERAVRAPSCLEGWTVGHVLTHLARNADSHTRMLVAALDGDAVEQYAGGGDERADAIAADGGRPETELRADVVRATADLEAAWAAMTPLAWHGHGLSTSAQGTSLGTGPRSTSSGSCPSLWPRSPSAWPTPPNGACSWPGSRAEPDPAVISTSPGGSRAGATHQRRGGLRPSGQLTCRA